jgi:dihydropteroate synthase
MMIMLKLIAQQTCDWGDRTYLMGVINVTPDSFSDGGQCNSVTAACQQAAQFVQAGADILDIGGESTRPGAAPVSGEQELARVIPVIQGIRQQGLAIPISIDTTKAAVARAAIAAGANLVNDVSGGIFDPAMLKTVAALGVPIALMHMRGTPATMLQLTEYQDLITEVGDFLADRIQVAGDCGISRSNLIIDPGIGFAKTYQQNIDLIKNLSLLRQRLQLPLLVGISRKSFIGQILQQPDPQQRVWGTAAAGCAAIANGADILRVHDVAAMHDVRRVADVMWRNPTATNHVSL